MSAAVVIHSGEYPYPQAVLARVSQPCPPPQHQLLCAGRPCRHATHMRSADGQSGCFTLDGARRERMPLDVFPSVRLRLRGARVMHSTTLDDGGRSGDRLSRYFSEAAARYRAHPAAGRWTTDTAESPRRPDCCFAFPDDPSQPQRRPFTVGGGTGNRKNLPSRPGMLTADAAALDASVATESRDQYRRNRRVPRSPDDAADAADDEYEEAKRHRERMRQSAQVADLLAPAEAAMAGDVRSRFWSESAVAAAAAAAAAAPVRRCSTAPAPRPDGEAARFRRVSGNRVLSRMRDQYDDRPVIF